MADRKPWSVKGIDTRARAAALEAARAEGVTLGDYINKLLLESSQEKDGLSPPVPFSPLMASSAPETHEVGSNTQHAKPIQPQLESVEAKKMSDMSQQQHAADLHENLDWLTSKIEAVEGRSTLAITGIDKSFMGLVARIESVENGQTESTDHITSVLEDVKGAQASIINKIRELEADDAPQKNLSVIKSLEQALGKLAAEMYTRHETLDRERKGVDERLSAIDKRNTKFMGQVRESEERVATQFDSYTAALEERLNKSHTESETRLLSNEQRQRQALSEAESRQREHIAELEDRVDSKLSDSIKASNRYVESQTQSRLATLQEDLTQKMGQAVQAQSEALVEFEARQEQVFANGQQHIENTEARIQKLENTTITRFEGLKDTTIKTVDTLAKSIKATHDDISSLQKAVKNEKQSTKSERKNFQKYVEESDKKFEDLVKNLELSRDAMSGLEKRLSSETQNKISDLAKNLGQTHVALEGLDNRLTAQDNRLSAQGANLDTRFKAQSDILETKLQSHGAALDDTMQAIGDVAGKVSDLSKRAESAEASTNSALQALTDNLGKLESHINANDNQTQNLFESFAAQLKHMVENNRADLTREISATIARTDALEQRLDSDMPASEENVEAMRESFDDLKKRVTSSEIHQAATLSTISREIDSFSERFEARLAAAENGVSQNAGKATDSLRGELIEFSKVIQERLGGVETGLRESLGQSEQVTAGLSQHLQEMERGFAGRMQEADERGQRAIEHVGQQVAAAAARTQQRQEEIMSKFDSRIGAIEQRTEDRLSSALTNISERLEQIQTQSSATMAPLQKSITDLSERVDNLEDFKSPSHAKGAPPVQAGPTGAQTGGFGPSPNMPAGNFRPNIASPMGPSGMDPMAPMGASQGFNTQPNPSPRNSSVDLRQNFAPSSSPMQSTATSKKAAKPGEGSAVKKLLPVALIGVAGLAAASFMLRGKSGSDNAATPQPQANFAPSPSATSNAPIPPGREALTSDIPDLAESEALLEAYDIQINAAQVDPTRLQGANAENIAIAAKPAATAPSPEFSALATLTPIVYSKPISAEQAAATGNADAQLIVARKRAEKGDAIGAADMLKQASSQGQGMAHYLLGQMYDMGRGVEKDPQKAFTYSRNAAQAGNIKAMHDYGAYLHEGKYVGRNDSESAVWFEKAAAHGVVDSQYNLGLMYMDGIGVAKSNESALYWLSLAQKAGDPDAGGIISALKSRMDPAAIARVNGRVSSWKKTPSKGAANGTLGTEPWNTDAKKTIKELQKALNIMGYNAGTPDGAIGRNTARAIRSFERDNGMGETGRLNEGLVHTVNAKIRESVR